MLTFLYMLDIVKILKESKSFSENRQKQTFNDIEGIPTMIKNYAPGNKIYLFDAVIYDQLPIIQIRFKNYQKTFNLRNYLNCEVEPHVEVIDEYRILFNWQLMSNTSKLYDKYCSQKSDIEKHFYCQGIKDFIRSEQQFLAQFQRNQEMEELRQLEAQQSRIQSQLCQVIMSTKKFNISIYKIITIILVCLALGYLFGSNEKEKGGLFKSNQNNKQSTRQKKVKSKPQTFKSEKKNKVPVSKKTQNKQKQDKNSKINKKQVQSKTAKSHKNSKKKKSQQNQQ